MVTEVRLPNLGENIASGDVVKLLVSVGETIRAEQGLVELETDKAVIEVPSPVGGRVREIHVKQGDKVRVGAVIAIIEADGAPARAPEPPAVATPPKPLPLPLPPLVSVHTPAPEPISAPTLAPRSAEGAPAAPSVRRFAREIGVDVSQVPGTGPGGRLSIEDVKAFAKRLLTAKVPAAPTAGAVPLPDFAKWGEIERQPMTAVRRKTMEHMSLAWSQIPHVTQQDQADITELEELRKRLSKQAEAKGAKVTVTAVALKVAAAALRKFPKFNASLDPARGEIVLKKYVHIGVAVDTDRGLIVPVIRDVDRKGIIELSIELAAAAERARTRKTGLEELQGGCFTITNLGGFGVGAFSPIVNWPEVAILGIGRASTQAVFVNGAFVPRLMMPLSLSYDHRLIDGADAARFVRWVAEAMQQPYLLVEG